jgi:hypothetical protein
MAVLAVVWLAIPGASYARNSQAQEPPPVHHPGTTPPSDAHFEILQLEVEPKWTLKLDRVTGNVEQLEMDAAGKPSWKRMKVLPHPKAVNETEPHFQIFVSQVPYSAVLLLDTDSGATWQLLSNAKAVVWQPIE